MNTNSSIEWTDGLTWNCVRGCSRTSPGCKHCYAEMIAARFSNPSQPFHGFAEFRIVGGQREPHWTGRVELLPHKLSEPLSKERWAKTFADKHGRKPRCFVNSMSDLFHEKLPDEAIDQVFAVMALCRWIDFLVLTKRAERSHRYFADPFVAERVDAFVWSIVEELIDPLTRRSNDLRATQSDEWPLPNVWLGVSVEDRARKERIEHLRRTPAAVRFLSIEPLLEDLGEIDLTGIDWCIVGGESGSGARPIHPDWVRSIRDQCVAAGLAFFFKQWGAWVPTNQDSAGCGVEHRLFPDGQYMPWAEYSIGPWGENDAEEIVRVGKKEAGRSLDGREWNEVPGVSKYELPKAAPHA